MERIAIIDHETHNLFIEEIDEELLQNDYNGEEEEYIAATYELSNNWSWDYITEAYFIPLHYEYPHEIDFAKLTDIV